MDRLTRAFYASTVAAGLSAFAVFLILLSVASPGFALEKTRAEIAQKRVLSETSLALDAGQNGSL